MNYILHNKTKFNKDQLEGIIPSKLIEIIQHNDQVAIVTDNVILIISLIYKYYLSDRKLLFVFGEYDNPNIKKEILQHGYNIIENIKSEIDLIKTYKTSNITAPISLFTSGTTGEPKLISHTWKSLNTFANVKNKDENSWFLSYAPTSYAWYQMVLMFLEIDRQNLILPLLQSANTIFDNIESSKITALSSTPTFWRYQLFNNSEFLQQLNLKQITLGGEFVDQNILTTLSDLYPHSKISHIYASTEAGANIVVHDKKEGFPIEWLESKKNSIKIIEKNLYLKSKYSSIDNQNSWYNTKDQVKIENDRVIIIGRSESRVANVGGNKVNLSFIEGILKGNPKVLYCRASTKKSPIVNNIIVAELILKNDLKIIEVENELFNYCLDKGMLEWMIPRKFYLADNIEVSKNFKMTEEILS